MNLFGYKKYLIFGSVFVFLIFVEMELKLIKENDVGYFIFGWWFKNLVFVFFVRFFFYFVCKYLKKEKFIDFE